jgi:IS30 family transposase
VLFSTNATVPLYELTKLTPVAIIAKALGYHPTTIERHAIAFTTTYDQYVGARANSNARLLLPASQHPERASCTGDLPTTPPLVE